MVTAIPPERDGDEYPAERIEIRHERQDGGLGVRQDALRHFDPRRAQRRHTGRATALHGAAVGQPFARGRRLGCECGRPDREPLAPLTRGAEVDMDEPRAPIEAETEESDIARRSLERHRSSPAGSKPRIRGASGSRHSSTICVASRHNSIRLR